MPRNIPYHEMGEYLANLKPFEGNSMSARINHRGDYIVYSYSTIIAFRKKGSRTLWINDKKYSITTSKHQSMLHHITKNRKGWTKRAFWRTLPDDLLARV